MTSRKEKKPARGRTASSSGPEEMVSIPAEEFEGMVERCRQWADYKDRYLRTLAEAENIRKRVEKEKREYIDFATQDLIYELIQVVDNFDRALASGRDEDREDPFRRGVEMIRRQLKEVLAGQGLEEINAVGEKFDPFLHEAVEQVVSDDTPENTVVEEVLRGYILKGRLLRPSAVKVAGPPSAGQSSANA